MIIWTLRWQISFSQHLLKKCLFWQLFCVRKVALVFIRWWNVKLWKKTHILIQFWSFQKIVCYVISRLNELCVGGNVSKSRGEACTSRTQVLKARLKVTGYWGGCGRGRVGGGGEDRGRGTSISISTPTSSLDGYLKTGAQKTLRLTDKDLTYESHTILNSTYVRYEYFKDLL